MIRRTTRTTQPQQFVPVHSGGLYSRGLVFAAYPINGVWIDVVSRQIAAIKNGTKTATYSHEGKSLSGATYRFNNQTGIDRLTTQGTLLAIARLPTASTYLFAGSFDDIISGVTALALGFDNNALFGEDVLLGTLNGSNYGVSILGADAELAYHRTAISWGPASANLLGYHDSQEIAFGTSATVTGDANRRTLINTQTYSGEGGDFRIALFLAWDRQLTRAEITGLLHNPWQVFAPTLQRIWLDTSITITGWGRLLSQERNRLVYIP